MRQCANTTSCSLKWSKEEVIYIITGLWWFYGQPEWHGLECGPVALLKSKGVSGACATSAGVEYESDNWQLVNLVLMGFQCIPWIVSGVLRWIIVGVYHCCYRRVFIKWALAGLRNCLIFQWMLLSADSTKYDIWFCSGQCNNSRFPQFVFPLLDMVCMQQRILVIVLLFMLLLFFLFLKHI